MAGLVLRPAANVCGNPSFSAPHRGETFARVMRAGDGDGIRQSRHAGKGISCVECCFSRTGKAISSVGFRFSRTGKAISCAAFCFPTREKRFPVRHFAFPTREKRFPVRDFAFPTREKRFPVWDFTFPHGKRDFLCGISLFHTGKAISPIRKSDFIVAAHDCQATGLS